VSCKKKKKTENRKHLSFKSLPAFVAPSGRTVPSDLLSTPSCILQASCDSCPLRENLENGKYMPKKDL